MLEIKDISKQYKTGDLIQKALDHVSLNLRDNEFVAILGPSGSGKTTLLNIIGGLDRYDSGDLVINGISTKKYKDRDWDSYRNHTIGFVFQSYNLIPHQSILANVELALTISGISRKERTKRAKEALAEVGLGEQIHKKPNQLSGGQMQRVALARALVNNPDILLADEPTGALDSETSVQVMDLLKQVAKDRLVVMVTHNPELAEQYATRIVNLKDGVIRSDTNPFTPKQVVDAPIHKNMGKSSMSFLTALSLSLNNLLTKKARTILVAFAGSIGIIGIALILSLSTGVNAFIQKTEEDTLSEYPLEITKQAMNLSSMMESVSADDEEQEDGDVEAINMMGQMFNRVTTNDLKSLKKYLDRNEATIYQYARSVEYTYDVNPYIYQSDTSNGIYQVHPDTVLSSSGIMPTSSIYSSMSSNAFSKLPENEELYIDAYEVKTGKWPTAYNEIVLVLTQSGRVSDQTLYAMGLRDYADYQEIMENFSSGKSNEIKEYDDHFEYEDFLNVTFKLVNPSETYTYDEELKIWISKTDDESYMKQRIEDGETLKVVGVVAPKEDTDIVMLTSGLNYTTALQKYVMDEASTSEIVQQQLDNPDINVFTNEDFNANNSDMDLSDLFKIDENAFANAFQFDTSKLTLDASSFDLSSIDTAALAQNIPGVSADDLNKLLANITIDTSNIDFTKITTDLYEDYLKNNSQYANINDRFTAYLQDTSENGAFARLQSALNQVLTQEKRDQATNTINTINQELVTAYMQTDAAQDPTDPMAGYQEFLLSEQAQTIIRNHVDELMVFSQDDYQTILNAFADGFFSQQDYTMDELIASIQSYIESEQAQTVIMNDIREMIDLDGIQNQLMNSASSMLNNVMSSAMESVMNQLMNQISSSMTRSFASLSDSMVNAFSFNADALKDAFSMNSDQSALSSLFMSMGTSSSSLESNLSSLGYADIEDPNSIIIYPKDFESKTELKNIIDEYNVDMQNTDQEDKVIIYTDIVGTMMSSVTDIINVISYILIAFVAISLVVSSIMIGVITYISVLERQKEIGILRAIGASKRNISNVFNAETFITGLLAGVFGIGITELLLIPGNYIIHTLTGRTDVTAILPMNAAIILILLSVVLTLIGGIIPSKKASNSDPVKALRTD